MTKLSNFITILLTALCFHVNLVSSNNNVQYIEQGEKIVINPSYTSYDLHTFCYKGRKKFIIYIWQSVLFQLDHPNDEYTLYEGSSPEEVREQYTKNLFFWPSNIFMTKQKNFKINPFNMSCIGIKTTFPYTVQINVINIDFWKLIFLGVGISLFISADVLSKNTAFHFLSGIVFGICASVLILIYFISKIFPKKPLMFGVLGVGWTLVVYIWHLIWGNMQIILTDYKFYVMWYFLITGFISFLVCYRWGPVTNKRTINLIKWSLQFLALCSIFNSSNYQEAAMAQIVILLISYNLPQSWKLAPKSYWKRRFPPKVRLLSNEEYYQQGVRETAKALDELRQYCASPESNPWKTALKLKDVKRFASFMEGNSHISDEEILEYESVINDINALTDEEDEEEED